MSEMTQTAIYIVDAFTREKYKGNSAAICPVDFDQVISTATMQNIAAEMNLSETAFVTPVNSADRFSSGSKFYLRWFSPTCEVPLCGHATLATACVLFCAYGNKSDSLEFDTQSGKLVATLDPENRISINLPSYMPKSIDIEGFPNLITAVVGSLPVQDVLYSPSNKLLIHLADSVTREELESLKPNDKELLAATKGQKVVGVIVTLLGEGKHDCKNELGDSYDFISRYFAPWLGISEDPVTGSAHAVLGPYWSSVLNKDHLFARQCSPRGGELYIKVSGSRTTISGDSVIVLHGMIQL